jgi:hypothetical protein
MANRVVVGIALTGLLAACNPRVSAGGGPSSPQAPPRQNSSAQWYPLGAGLLVGGGALVVYYATQGTDGEDSSLNSYEFLGLIGGAAMVCGAAIIVRTLIVGR